MAGTKESAKRAAITNKLRYGNDFYINIGKAGGMKSRGGGFAAGEEGRQRAKIAGSLGGKNSRRNRDEY